MTADADFAASKDHKGENFPVASVLIARKHRPLVMAFYRVARMSDDVADNAEASPQAKLARLSVIEASLKGESDEVPESVALRAALAERGLGVEHPLDLLTAFKRDVTQTRYADWADLMDYCRYSAAPVGRFLLDVHGEDRATWPASDALCSALQVINHLQDCAEDYREIDRVYLPQDALDAAGTSLEALTAPAASPELRAALKGLTEKTQDLLAVSKPFAAQVKDLGLALEIGVIQTLAESLTRRLLTRDPLSQRVHHSKWEVLPIALAGAAFALGGRLGSRQAALARP